MKNNTILIYVFLSLLSVLFSCNKKLSTSQLYVIEENGLYGFIDHIGNKAIEPQFIYAQNFTEGLALVVVDTIYGECVDSLAYKNTGEKTSKEPCLFVKYGYIDKSGKFVIEPKLLASLFVSKEDIGKIDLEIFNINHDLLGKYAFGSKRALYQDTTTWKYGYIDCNGKIVIPAKYEYAKRFRQSRAVALKYTGKPLDPHENKCHYGIIDENDSTIADFIYDNVTDYGSNHSIVRVWKKSNIEGPQNVITKDDNGEYRINNSPNRYNIKKETFRNGWSETTLILDKNGKIKDTLSSALIYYGFSNGISVSKDIFLSTIYNRDCFGYIDTLGHTIKPLDGITEEQTNEMFLSKQAFSYVPDESVFLYCTRFSNNLAGVTLNGNVCFFVDKHLLIRGKGLEDTYECIRPFCFGLAAVKKNGKWGFVNTSLKRIIPCKYDSCEDNSGFLNKVYTFKGDSIISMYINRKDSIVWKHTDLRGWGNKYNNKYSQKPQKNFRKLREDAINTYSNLIGYCIAIAVVIIVVLAYTRYNNRRIKKLMK